MPMTVRGQPSNIGRGQKLVANQIHGGYLILVFGKKLHIQKKKPARSRTANTLDPLDWRGDRGIFLRGAHPWKAASQGKADCIVLKTLEIQEPQRHLGGDSFSGPSGLGGVSTRRDRQRSRGLQAGSRLAAVAGRHRALGEGRPD